VTERTPRIAAVLILVYPRGGQPHLVFTERTTTLPNHPGQISLPGGSRDPADPSLEFTALREAEEELGIPSADVRVLGQLGDVDTLGGSFRITPYVGLLEYEPQFRPQAAEVATVIEVSLAHLQKPDVFSYVERDARGKALTVRCCDLGGYSIIGPTAEAVEEFLTSDHLGTASLALSSPELRSPGAGL
jgi:8-oxo-dGTP pyrophosphatase MutT (NUDIX family)